MPLRANRAQGNVFLQKNMEAPYNSQHLEQRIKLLTKIDKMYYNINNNSAPKAPAGGYLLHNNK